MSGKLLDIVLELEDVEKDVCNLPMIFAEMFKDEINANDEQMIYNDIKDVIKRYSDDKNAILVINEFTKAISGGASLEEILQITKEEAQNPTLSSEITVDTKCKLDRREP